MTYKNWCTYFIIYLVQNVVDEKFVLGTNFHKLMFPKRWPNSISPVLSHTFLVIKDGKLNTNFLATLFSELPRLFSSVRSSNSHPDLLMIQHHPPTHFFRSHRSSTLDFHFLSHYSYIKAIELYKGNHWTQLLATCIANGYNRTSLQDSARKCKVVQVGAR